MPAKTNAMRILDGLGIAYRVIEYRIDPDDLAAEKAAVSLGMPPEQVFKTLVVRGDRSGVALAVIPAGTRLDLKALARLAGDRKVDTVPLKEVQPLTGYLRGAVTALGCKKAYRVFLHASAERLDAIGVSAGARGVEIVLAPADYARAVDATVGEIAVPASPSRS
ncbi:MAG TPA: Cys-tRNA(Pro) deacylase [Candidatus Binatia bacterium]|nr:Cys-tRNA(Pro) deacylase [Candidatus Binatia bacterium]